MIDAPKSHYYVQKVFLGLNNIKADIYAWVTPLCNSPLLELCKYEMRNEFLVMKISLWYSSRGTFPTVQTGDWCPDFSRPAQGPDSNQRQSVFVTIIYGKP